MQRIIRELRGSQINCPCHFQLYFWINFLIFWISVATGSRLYNTLKKPSRLLIPGHRAMPQISKVIKSRDSWEKKQFSAERKFGHWFRKIPLCISSFFGKNGVFLRYCRKLFGRAGGIALFKSGIAFCISQYLLTLDVTYL